MPRVTEHVSQGRAKGKVDCARCPKPIVKGERYYQWAIKAQRGGTVYRQHTSHGRPRQSQLTHSRMGEVYAAIEGGQDGVAGASEPSEVAEVLRSAAGDLESVKDEFQSGFDNMPEGLQQGETGQLIEQRVEALDTFIQELNDAADECENMEGEEPAEGEEDEDNGLQEAQDRANEALDSFSE